MPEKKDAQKSARIPSVNVKKPNASMKKPNVSDCVPRKPKHV